MMMGLRGLTTRNGGLRGERSPSAAAAGPVSLSSIAQTKLQQWAIAAVDANARAASLARPRRIGALPVGSRTNERASERASERTNAVGDDVQMFVCVAVSVSPRALPNRSHGALPGGAMASRGASRQSPLLAWRSFGELIPRGPTNRVAARSTANSFAWPLPCSNARSRYLVAGRRALLIRLVGGPRRDAGRLVARERGDPPACSRFGSQLARHNGGRLQFWRAHALVYLLVCSRPTRVRSMAQPRESRPDWMRSARLGSARQLGIMSAKTEHEAPALAKKTALVQAKGPAASHN